MSELTYGGPEVVSENIKLSTIFHDTSGVPYLPPSVLKYNLAYGLGGVGDDVNGTIPSQSLHPMFMKSFTPVGCVIYVVGELKMNYLQIELFHFFL